MRFACASIVMAGLSLASSCTYAFSCSISKVPGDVIFVGTVVSYREWKRTDGATDEYSVSTRVLFAVEKPIKGLQPKKRRTVVETSGLGEFPFYQGKRYLVHAYDKSEHGIPAFVDKCGQTNEVK
jgi:hypothetical protein